MMMGDYMIALHNPDNAIFDITLAHSTILVGTSRNITQTGCLSLEKEKAVLF